jgi:hypothetical protein
MQGAGCCLDGSFGCARVSVEPVSHPALRRQSVKSYNRSERRSSQGLPFGSGRRSGAWHAHQPCCRRLSTLRVAALPRLAAPRARPRSRTLRGPADSLRPDPGPSSGTATDRAPRHPPLCALPARDDAAGFSWRKPPTGDRPAGAGRGGHHHDVVHGLQTATTRPTKLGASPYPLVDPQTRCLPAPRTRTCHPRRLGSLTEHAAS